LDCFFITRPNDFIFGAPVTLSYVSIIFGESKLDKFISFLSCFVIVSVLIKNGILLKLFNH